VYGICLFNNLDNLDKTPGEHIVLVPKKTMFLPGTALLREVYYFPPTEGSTEGRIIVGSEAKAQSIIVDDKFFGRLQGDLYPCTSNNVAGLKGYLSPPIGCYLGEKEDLGGWGKSEDVSNIPKDLGIGRLDRRRERFDPDDDCDCEY